MRTCSKCKLTQPETDFYLQGNGSGRLSSWCKECGKVSATKRRHKNMAAGLCPCGRQKSDPKEYKCSFCEDYRKRTIHIHLAAQKKNLRKTRNETLDIYGSKCACCGESEKAFLQFHHKNGGGNKHRQEIGGHSAFLWWLRKNNYPDCIELQCANCHAAITCFGFCPHRKLKAGVA